MNKKIWPYLLLIVNLAVILFFWQKNSGGLLVSGPVAAALALGRIAGLLLVLSVLLQVIFISRAPWLEKLFGLDSLSRAHQKNGMWLTLFLAAHPVLIVWSYAQGNSLSFLGQIRDFMFGAYPDLFGAYAALALFLGVIIFSLAAIRRKFKYETWYFAHLSVYIAILASFGHQISLGGDFGGQPIFAAYWYLLYAFTFGNLILFRFA